MFGLLATMQHGDLGADIVKVEDRQQGDEPAATGLLWSPAGRGRQTLNTSFF
jgi:hypothetical protein